MTSKKKKYIGKYEVIQFPKNRKMVIDIMEQGIKKHYVKGLVEFDVTNGRRILKEYKSKKGISSKVIQFSCLTQNIVVLNSDSAKRAYSIVI